MKKLILFIISILVISFNSSGQQAASDFTGKSDREQQRNPRNDQMNFVPNEVLVKFKDEVKIPTGNNLKAVGITAVDKVLSVSEGISLEKLFPGETKFKGVKIVKDPQGQDMKIPSLHNIYKISIPQLKSSGSIPVNIFQFIEELKALSEVDYAEPNYIFSVDDVKPVGSVITAEDMVEIRNNKQKNTQEGIVPNDPLYSQQWYIPAVKADLVWEQTTGDTTQIIAILDTGVDWNHPDLKNKIWRNPGEVPDNGRDDDGNGLIDDARGWDYINNDNNPMDDNSHGTHVAGIAAAETNNGIGIAGVNWKAKILPLKVFQSSGRGDAANISKGIIYAFQKGATVINMSFGSYARSLTMENALANAYATTLLVAAAGNDGLALESCIPAGQFFPAAFSFVLGVQAPEASFSNYDCNGPTYSNTSDLVNYEMKAPGTNILSTIPHGNYRVYQGTSMAAPLVSGALSLYRKLIPFEEETPEFMWVKLIQATEQYLNLYKALTIVPIPEIWFLNNVMVDTIGNADRDGRVDAGESIQLWFRARNTGGQVDSVYWKIRLAEFEDPTTCTIVKPTSYLGSISPYATRTSETDPMVFDISPNVAHDRDITFDLLSWYKGASDTLVRKFVFTAENGEELSGVLDKVKTLYPDRLYLVNQSFKVGVDGTLIIKPGTKILFYPGKTVPVNGKLIAEGTADSLIYLEGYNPPLSTGAVSSFFYFLNDRNLVKNRFNYCSFKNSNWPVSDTYRGNPNPASIVNSFFEGLSLGIVDSLVNNKCNFSISSYGNTGVIYSHSYAYNNNFIGPSTSKDYYYNSGVSHVSFGGNYKHNNIINYSIPGQEWIDPNMENIWISEYSKPQQSWNGSFYEDVTRIYTKYYTSSYSSADFQKVQYQYWGTSDSTTIEGFIQDFMENSTWPRAVFEPYLTAPPEECHGIVWKVLVNGKDAQDEKVEPLGIGKQRFDVYFNRPMDKTVAPLVGFGVRYPFSSNTINEDGSWSDDGKIYTVYKTIKLTSGDGINRIRVTSAKDLEGWEIPTEDMRFEFLINAATSASLDFMATAGLGKVALEWNNNDLEDGLGYNMYRMEHVNDSVLTNPVLVNSSLITDTLYTDFSVTPNKKYYYYYKILRTSLVETDSSRVVSAVPFTASKGDANGDLSVNVLDITTIVAYLLNHNPQPFIMEAADLNSDGNINVLDIVGVVNLILNPNKKTSELSSNQPAQLYIESDTLFVDSSVAIGGVQFDISGTASIEEIKVLQALEGFESGYAERTEGLRILYYSMSGKTIPAGIRIPLLKLKKGSGVTEAIFADKNGGSIPVHFQATGIWNLREDLSEKVAVLGQNFPNPLTKLTSIPIKVFEPIDEAVVRVYTIYGQEVDAMYIKHPVIGEHFIQWNPGIKRGFFVYKLEIKRGKQRFVSPVRKMLVQ